MIKLKSISILLVLFSYSLIWTLNAFIVIYDAHNQKVVEWSSSAENEKQSEQEYYFASIVDSFQFNEMKVFSRKPKVVYDSYIKSFVSLKRNVQPPEC